MNNNAETSASHSSEPSPGRHALLETKLIFGLSAPPLAWMGQLVINTTIVLGTCKQGAQSANASLVIYFVNIVALVVAFLALLSALRAWRSVKTEAPGSQHHLLDAGEGRSRFFAFWALVAGVVFSVAILASSVSFFLPRNCL